MKNTISRTIAWLLPRHLVYWVMIRAYAKATQVYSDKTPDEITFEMMMRQWEEPKKIACCPCGNKNCPLNINA